MAVVLSGPLYYVDARNGTACPSCDARCAARTAEEEYAVDQFGVAAEVGRSPYHLVLVKETAIENVDEELSDRPCRTPFVAAIGVALLQ